ncbi:hypothetical protein SCLCIDRAFT_482954 [Scleroderma citrinum Foug A]|uniref:Uncharacterized protein n=1 Tax=Scleroderma citrinum Foug A TaxID=1036808 RepID=A0A0C3CWD9_9AGAM|nr:hypothetical protein SCLCIDRAFT_482954 [Scleroderma citrinum Foug A]
MSRSASGPPWSYIANSLLHAPSVLLGPTHLDRVLASKTQRGSGENTRRQREDGNDRPLQTLSSLRQPMQPATISMPIGPLPTARLPHHSQSATAEISVYRHHVFEFTLSRRILSLLVLAPLFCLTSFCPEQ